MLKKRFSLTLLLALLLTGCGKPTSSGEVPASSAPPVTSDVTSIPDSESSQTEEQVLPAPTVKAFYENSFGEDKIPGQWEAYGVGDPFVYRFNGVYYLYVSTKDSEVGVRAWKSLDLINFEPITGEGMPEGYVANDEITKAAYAPEIMYNDGFFYMVTSPAGNGHYILKASKPEGPFVPITDNFGQSIDGSFFQDDDEKIYLLRANAGNLRYLPLKSDWTPNTLGARTVSNTQIGNWTEGPYILNRNGISYLTFTGTHVTSAGYRVAYSYSEEGPVKHTSYIQDKKSIILNTDPEFNGLGHSATVLGPDLDSYYIVYHNLLNSGGPIRAYSMNRLYFNGTDMVSPHARRYQNVAPEMATFTSHNAAADLDVAGDFLLSPTATKDAFTAEWNIKSSAGQMVFSYEDANNYSYMTFDGRNVTLKKVDGGAESDITSFALKTNHPTDVLHTFRIIYRDGVLDVTYDNMNKVLGHKVTLAPGKVGYKGFDTAAIGFTGYSDFARGTSDNYYHKQEMALANSYHLETSELTTSVLQKVEGDYVSAHAKAGSYDLNLVTGDKARYLMYFDASEYYALSMTVPIEMMGKSVTVSIDGITKALKVPTYELYPEERYVKVELGRFPIYAGSHYVSVIATEEFRFNNFDFTVVTDSKATYENDLSTLGGDTLLYQNIWKIKRGGHYASSGNRQLLYIGKGIISDVTIEADINFDGPTAANTVGFLLRAGNEAFSTWENNDSIQGYYVAMNNAQVSIRRKDYNWSVFLDSYGGSFASETDIRLKASIKGNLIIVYVNGEEVIRVADAGAFRSGKLGLYTDGASATYKNLKVTLG